MLRISGGSSNLNALSCSVVRMSWVHRDFRVIMRPSRRRPRLSDENRLMKKWKDCSVTLRCDGSKVIEA